MAGELQAFGQGPEWDSMLIALPARLAYGVSFTGRKYCSDPFECTRTLTYVRVGLPREDLHGLQWGWLVETLTPPPRFGEGTMQLILFNFSLTSFRGLVFALFTTPKFTLFSVILDPGRSSLVICNVRII